MREKLAMHFHPYALWTPDRWLEIKPLTINAFMYGSISEIIVSVYFREKNKITFSPA